METNLRTIYKEFLDFRKSNSPPSTILQIQEEQRKINSIENKFIGTELEIQIEVEDINESTIFGTVEIKYKKETYRYGEHWGKTYAYDVLMKFRATYDNFFKEKILTISKNEFIKIKGTISRIKNAFCGNMPNQGNTVDGDCSYVSYGDNPHFDFYPDIEIEMQLKLIEKCEPFTYPIDYFLPEETQQEKLELAERKQRQQLRNNQQTNNSAIMYVFLSVAGFF